MNCYFENLKSDYRTDYLTKSPTKKGALNNANVPGKAEILPGSNNRALIIRDGNKTYLQSYDTIILALENGIITKFYNDYTVTTLKHINSFCRLFNLPGFNKKEWLSFKGV